jgi:hypothetical protein
MQVGICCYQETMLFAKIGGAQSMETSSALWLHGFNRKQYKILGFHPTGEDELERVSPFQ